MKSKIHRGGAEDAEVTQRLEPLRTTLSESVNSLRPLGVLCASAVSPTITMLKGKVT
ncbi:MAG TPA: hypothetical protein VEX60_00740 [Pyrinomonadaceae bacterium]|nr:hypothetical protein [Pyrinomonadaceae bacterium]